MTEPVSPDLEAQDREDDIAVIGLTGRFPGAGDLDELWRNLEAGIESVRELTVEELIAAGVPRDRIDDPRFIRAAAPLEDIDRFDARFFDLSPREAEIIDPQQRMFLECAWHALEDAGYDSRQSRERIGVFAAVGSNTYLFNIYSQPEVLESAGRFNIVIGNENDYLASRVSFKLDLRGPSVNVQSACSSSLLAVHLACESLHSGESDIALAGGVYAAAEQIAGYYFREGDIKSVDGHCRPFDSRSSGTIFSAGVGAVVLKRLADALADGDTVRAVLRGSAVNNDGALKVGFTAPGVQGQRAVVTEALAVSGVDPETIGYVEAHGTGTALGDPIEVTALTQAFRAHTDKRGFCALGSIKGNIGHADSAAGIAGLSKAVLSLQHRKIPASLNFESPNPRIDFDSSPFFVNDRLRDWDSGTEPRRAAVSSFGIGGTNVHVVLEEAPPAGPTAPSRPWHLLTLSARTPGALERAAENLGARLEADPPLDLADSAFTLMVGRRSFEHRRAFVCRDRDDAVAVLRGDDPKRLRSGLVERREPRVAFLFSGQGSQYAGMAAELYRGEPGFRVPLDRCAELLAPRLGLDLRRLLFPEPGEEEAAGERLAQTELTQPALFAVEYALAQLWMEWGIEPDAMMGHSVGEYVAACLAGVLEPESALALVAARGRLMQALAAGSMLGVSLPAAELEGLLSGGLALAATNGPKRSVVSGPTEEVSALEERLWERGVACRPLHTSHAFHSPMMEPMLEPFRAELAQVELRAPRVPFVSNVTGTWIRAEEATDPEYWLRHARGTVRFSEGIATLAEEPERVFLEVGPGTTLATLVRQHPTRSPAQPVIASTRHPRESSRSDVEALLDAAAELWATGAALDGSGVYRHERRRRLPLPGYPFELDRYWIARSTESRATLMARRRELPDWFYLPAWRPSVPPALPAELAQKPMRWMLMADEAGFSGRLAGRLAERLGAFGQDVVTVRAAGGFERRGDRSFAVRPGRRDDVEAVLEDLAAAERLPDVVVHLLSVDPVPGTQTELTVVDEVQERGFYDLLALAQGLGRVAPGRPVRLLVASTGVQRTGGEGAMAPEKATLLGPCRVIPREYPHVTCKSVDVDVPAAGSPEEDELTAHLLAEACTVPADDAPEGVAGFTVVYRGGERRLASYAPVTLEAPAPEALPLRPEGVYLVTGGLGGIGLAVADHLARELRARLVLVGRTALPPREQWEAWLAAHEEDDRTAVRIRAVCAMEAAGAEVAIEAADVADREQMAAVMARIRERFGALHGVLHAAGVAGGGMIQLKERAAAAEVLRPKLAGTLALASAVEGERLDFFVLCSSTFAVMGGIGQVDYAAGNAFLQSFAHARRLGGAPCTAIDWAAWKEVGMAVEGLGARPATRPAARPTGGTPQAAPAAEEPVFGQVLLGEREERGPQRATYRSRMTAGTHWVLAEHRVAGAPTVPGTTWLELARAAFEDAAGPGPVCIRDLAFAQPFTVTEGATAECRIRLERRAGAEDAYDFVVEGRLYGEEAWRTHATGWIEAAPEAQPKVHDLARLLEACPKGGAVDAEALTRPGGLVEWGPRWASLRSMRAGDEEVVAELELPERFRADLDGVVLHPALLDVATAAATFAIARESFLPLSYRRVEVLRPIPARFFSHARLRSGSGSGETLSFDITVLDPEGEECVRIEGFTLKRVGAAVERLERAGEAAAPTAGVYAKGGMTNADGIEALRRVLSVPRLAQVVVSPMDLEALLRTPAPSRAGAAGSRAAAGRERHARPDTGQAFVEPQTDVERTIAAIWSDVLGVEEVGLDDDFFRLGGDSVLGIQVVARTAEAGITIRPEQLFEHATLRELAAAVSGEAAPGGEAEGIAVTPFQRRALEGSAAPWVAAAVRLQGIGGEAVEARLVGLVERHEALRLRFREGADSRAATIGEPGPPPALERLALDAAGETGDGALHAAAETLARSLDPVRGPVLAAGWAGGDAGGGTLLLVAHRAAADGPALVDLCLEAAHGAVAAPLGAGRPCAGTDPVVVAELGAEAADALSAEVAEVLRAQPHEVLVAALARAVPLLAGSGPLALEVEWDGRASDRPAPGGAAAGSSARSSLFPLGHQQGPTPSPAEALRRVKEARRPSEDDRVVDPASSWVRAVLIGATGGVRVWVGGETPGAMRPLLEVQASIDGTGLRLELRTAREGRHDADLGALAADIGASLEALARSVREGETEVWSPSDFPEAELDQEMLDSVLAKLDR